MSMRSFYERVQAADPNKIDLSCLCALDPSIETKIGEIDEFERRIVVVGDELLLEIQKAREAYDRAEQAHRDYHKENPKAKHGGPLCEAVAAAYKVGEALSTEHKEIMSIMSSVIRIRFPEHVDACIGIRSDGSIALKPVEQSPENDFARMLEGVLEGTGAQVRIVRI